MNSNWYIRAVAANGSIVSLFRGEYAGNKGGRFWTTDREWARQFTQSGKDDEILEASIAASDIFESDAYAGDLDAIDAAVAEARSNGKNAVRLSEGDGQPKSVYVFDSSALHPVSQRRHVSSGWLSKTAASFSLPAWAGVVDLRDGRLLATYTYQQAEEAGFHHTFVVGNLIHSINDGDAAYFWLHHGKPEKMNGPMPPWLAGSIVEQLNEMGQPAAAAEPSGV